MSGSGNAASYIDIGLRLRATFVRPSVLAPRLIYDVNNTSYANGITGRGVKFD